ncbi:methylmalonyl-CoA mutase family protein [Rhodocytophaga aerolata]|uniref:Methylmalonyl-CoA mutase family protein n=1 Tax=Rhodocytophaga aerolata TaxID=455078 RepID=A0ABT8RJD1_9BACT|nr:methylmalonyl-CoA mutase family protein [Rhodocytophaga aerolata]MDO1451000.1 methylmalonyl-CoA mutase family protein [Rhodocytophaga aerolata]
MNVPDEKNLSFPEFSPSDSQAWRAQILQDIRKATAEEKEAVYEEKMRWKTYEGITIEPFYTQQDIASIPEIRFPAPAQGWQNRQYIEVRGEKEANAQAQEAISGGADALLLDLSKTTGPINLSHLLQHMKLSQTPVSFQVQHFSIDLLTQLQQIAPYLWKGSVYYDPLAAYRSGKEGDLDSAVDLLAQAIPFTSKHPQFRTLTVSSHHFHEAGASAVQELAFLLNSFVEYAHQLSERGIAIQGIFASTEFSVSVSTNYFMEIAKIRALHLLWQQVSKAYQVESNPAYIHAHTARWNKPASDAYNNMIRATIEAMAAALGGVASMTVMPYNNNPNDALATRIAKNVSLILKEESYFDNVLDVASGSYYLESLTQRLAAEAWKLFQTVEASGGYRQAVKDGFIKEQLMQVRKAKEADLQSGKQVLVGVNKYVPKEVSEPGFSVFKNRPD